MRVSPITTIFIFLLSVNLSHGATSNARNYQDMRKKTIDLLICQTRIAPHCGKAVLNIENSMLLGGKIHLIDFQDSKKRLFYNVLQDYLVLRFFGSASKEKFKKVYTALMEAEDFSGEFVGRPFGIFANCVAVNDRFGHDYDALLRSNQVSTCMAQIYDR